MLTRKTVVAALLGIGTFNSMMACSDHPTAVREVATAGASAARSSTTRTIQTTMNGAFIGAAQQTNGSQSASGITASGNYNLAMNLGFAGATPVNPENCPQQPGAITWESGLINFVAQNTPATGSLNVDYDVPLDANRVDNWTVAIGSYSYKVQFFRWSLGAEMATNADGSRTVAFRGGSIEAFKYKRGKLISREQCFGNFVNYDFTGQ